jgi:hypothetical protein
VSFQDKRAHNPAFSVGKASLSWPFEVFQYFNRRPPEPPPSPPTVALLHSGTSTIFFFIVLAACSPPFSESIFSFLVNKKESHIYSAQTIFDLPKICSIC